MSKTLKLAVVVSIVWALVTVITLFNIVYIDRPQMGGDFWLVFLRSVALVTAIPLIISWGIWWIFKRK